jgi:hypothetical protein
MDAKGFQLAGGLFGGIAKSIGAYQDFRNETRGQAPPEAQRQATRLQSANAVGRLQARAATELRAPAEQGGPESVPYRAWHTIVEGFIQEINNCDMQRSLNFNFAGHDPSEAVLCRMCKQYVPFSILYGTCAICSML